MIKRNMPHDIIHFQSFIFKTGDSSVLCGFMLHISGTNSLKTEGLLQLSVLLKSRLKTFLFAAAFD